MQRWILVLFQSVVTVLITSCAAPFTSRGAFAEISDSTRERLGHPVHWQRGGDGDLDVAKRIHELLQHDLSIDDAVHISLLNNRDLQVVYETLGIAYADMLQACTIANPVVTALGRFPLALGVTSGELNFLQNVVDIVMMPLRRDLAVQYLEVAQRKLTHRVFETAFAARSAFVRVQASQRMLEVRSQILDELGRDKKVAELRNSAAGVADVDLALGRATYQQVELELAHDKLQLISDREALAQLLSLENDDADFRVEATLPIVPTTEVGMKDLQKTAFAARWDLAGVLAETQAIERALDVTRKTWWLASVSLGAADARDAEGTHTAGPTLVFELPIFNRRRAHIARLESQLRDAEQRFAALRVKIGSEVRKAREAVALTRAIAVPFQEVLLPLRHRVIELSRLNYGHGKLNAYELLLALQSEMNARRNAVTAVRDYWLARIELDRVVSVPRPSVQASGV